MKALFIFSLCLFICFPLSAELTRKDRVTYTLDYYETGTSLPKIETYKKEISPQPGKYTVTKKSRLDKYDEAKKAPSRKSLGKKAKVKISQEKIEKKPKEQLIKKTPQVDKKTYGTQFSFKKPSPAEKKKEKQISGAAVLDEKEKKLSPEEEAKIMFEGKEPGILKTVLKNTHPYLTVLEQYNDNLYLLRNDAKMDYITKIYPGFEFKSKLAENRMNLYLNVGLESLLYLRERHNNHESLYGSGLFGYKLGRLEFNSSAEARRLRGTPSGLTDLELPQFIDAWNYDYQQAAKLSFNRFNTEIQYRYRDTQYLDAAYKDSNITGNIIALRNSLKFFPKTSFFVEYAHGWLNYDKDVSRNWDYDKIYFGAKGKLFTKLEGLVKAGYTFSREKTDKDISGNTVYVNLTYKASPRLYYNLDLTKTIGDVGLINEGVSKAKGVSLGAAYLPPFLKRLRLNTNVSYWQRGSDYATRDTYWQYSFSPQCRFKNWLSVGLAYDYKQRTSKTKGHEYRNSTIGLTLASEF